jgi:uncharacterized protein DUF3631
VSATSRSVLADEPFKARNTPRDASNFDLGSTRLIEDVLSFIRRFVVLTLAQATIVSLWVFHTHCFEAAEATPYLAITSAEKQSGKTRLLEVLALLVERPWFTARVTAAVLVRKIDASTPTLLLDESDAAFQGNHEYAEALRGILNSGYRRGGVASACTGKGTKLELTDFQTFCPKAIAGIGKLPDTVADRSVPIRLKRKAQGEGVLERFRLRLIGKEAANLEKRVASWAHEYLEALRTATPNLPDALTDRQQDGIEPLLAIADAIGDGWPEQARRSILEIVSGGASEDLSVGVRLLADIRTVFDQSGEDRCSSLELVRRLTDIETSPWSEWNRGKPINPTVLSRLLKPFDVGPRTIRSGEETFKGYLREAFEDLWKRYLKHPSPLAPELRDDASSPPSQVNKYEAYSNISRPSRPDDVTVSRSPSWAELGRIVTIVTREQTVRDAVDIETVEGEL